MNGRVQHGLVPSWIALVLLPAVVFLDRISANIMGDAVTPSLADPLVFELAGLLSVALVSVLTGPHLASFLALFATTLGMGMFAAGFETGAAELVLFGGRGLMLGVLASAGASNTGAAPGLRYATFVAIYVAANAALLVNPYGMAPLVFMPAIPVVTMLTMLVCTVSWWSIQNHPARGGGGVTERTALIAGVLAVIVATTVAATQLLWNTVGRAQLGSSETANILAVVGLGIPVILVLLVLQALNRPARLGVAAGVGAMIISLTAVLGWSTQAVPVFIAAFLLGLGEVLLFPWAYARATSDAYWRACGPLAVLVLAPQLALGEAPALVPVAGALLLAIAAIPIGMLGWLGDEWVLAEEPGSEKARR